MENKELVSAKAGSENGLIMYDHKSHIVLSLGSPPPFEDFTLIDDPDDTKSVKKVEGLIRQSGEYSRYIKRLKAVPHMDKCVYMSNVPSDIIKVEMHHAPFTLFDITQTVISKHVTEKGFACEFDVADEVCMLHWKNLVGLLPIGITVHELAHNFKIPIHPNDVYGNWKKFVVLYKDYFTDEVSMKYNDVVDAMGKPKEKPIILEVKNVLIEIDNLPRLSTETSKVLLLEKK